MFLGYAFFICVSITSLILFRFVFHITNKKTVIVSFVCLGFLLYTYIQNKIQIQEEFYASGFIYQDKTKSFLEGRIIKFPSYTYSNNKYIVQLEDNKTYVLVYTQPSQKFGYLDSLSFTSSLQDVRVQDPKWHPYYQKLGVQYVVWYPAITNHTEPKLNTFKEYILKKIFVFKTFIREKSIERFSSHTSALVLGMLLGEKDELSKEEKDMFNKANLSHILVVSGYNISILISFVFLLLQNFSRYFKTFFAINFVFLFVLLVGFDASVVRSALMGSIVIVGKILHKQSSGIHTLFLVATCMLIHNPFILFDAGFHLSFLATYSLLILPAIKKIPEYIVTTIWVFMFVSVYILYLSQNTSFVGIFTNILVLICVPLFMSIAGISILFSFFNIHILFDVFILDVLSRYIFFIAEISQYAPRMQYELSPQMCALIYVFVISIICFVQNRYTTKEFIEKHYQKFVPQKTN